MRRSERIEEGEDIGGITGEASQRQIPDLGFGFAAVFGPLIASAIIVSAILYSRNVLEVKRRIAELKTKM